MLQHHYDLFSNAVSILVCIASNYRLKVNLQSCACHKSIGGMEVQLHSFLTQHKFEISGQLHAPNKELPIPIQQEAEQPPQPVYPFGIENDISHLPSIESRLFCCSALSLFTIRTTPSRLRYIMNWKGCRKKRAWPNLRYYHGMYTEGLGKPTAILVITGLRTQL